MKKLLKLATAAMVLMIGPVSVVYAEPPNFGTIKDNTWTYVFTAALTGRHPGYTYSITPVPEMIELEYSTLFSLVRGSAFTVEGEGIELEIRAITDFDYGAMGEHTLGDLIFAGIAYTFDEPGQYTVFFKNGSYYIASLTVGVN